MGLGGIRSALESQGVATGHNKKTMHIELISCE